MLFGPAEQSLELQLLVVTWPWWLLNAVIFVVVIAIVVVVITFVDKDRSYTRTEF